MYGKGFRNEVQVFRHGFIEYMNNRQQNLTHLNVGVYGR